jgi:uncharacterized C2H2 Zn-finger protein
MQEIGEITPRMDKNAWKTIMRKAMFAKRMREISKHYEKSHYWGSPKAVLSMIKKKVRESLAKDSKYQAYC